MSMQRVVIYLFALYCALVGPCAMAQKLTDGQRQEQVYERASDLFRKEKYASAQQLFDQIAVQGGLTAPDATYFASVCAAKLENDDAALRLQAFLDRYPYSARCNMARFYLGNYFYSKGKYDKALTHFKQVKASEVEFNYRSEYNFKMGYSYLAEGDLKKAKSCFVQLRDGESKYKYAALYYYAHIQYADGEYELALSNFEKVKEDKKFAAIADNYIIRINYYLGRYDEVLAMAPALLESEGAYKPSEINQMIAEIYFFRAQYDEALPRYLAAARERESGDEPMDEHAAPTRADCSPQDNYYQIGYCYYMSQQLDSAAYYLQKLTACDDSVAQNALYTLGDIYLRQERKDEARSMFLQASSLNFNPVIKEESLFCYAKLSCELNKNPYNESIRSFQNYMQSYPSTKHKVEIQEIMASLYLSTSNYKDALSLLEDIPDRNINLEQAYQRILVNYGIELFNKGKVEEAADHFRKAGDVNANVKVSANAYYLYGESQYRLGNTKVAAKYIDRFLLSTSAKESPYYLQGLYTQGYIFLKDKEYGDAYDSFAKFVKVAKDDIVDKHQVCDAYNRMGDCRFMTRKYKEAIKQYGQVIEAGDEDADYAMFQTAMAYGVSGDDKNKFAYLQRLFDNCATSTLRPKALMEMGDTYMKLEDNANAMAKYEEYLKLYPKTSQAKQAMLNIGLIYYNTKQDEKALKVFDRLLKKYPDTDEARYAINAIKSIYIDQNRVEEYFAYIQKVANISISDFEQDSIMFLAAEDRYMTGEYSAAALSMENYLSRFPKGLFALKAHYITAESRRKLKQPDQALPHYLAVAAASKSQYTEPSILSAAGIAFDQKNYLLADSLYGELAVQAEASGNRIVGRLGVLRCRVLLDRSDEIEAAADALLAEDKITTEHREEALICKARVSYANRNAAEALERYEQLMNSSNGEYSGEAAYRRAKSYYYMKQYDLAEKEIEQYVGEAASDYWLAKSFILWADIFYYVHHNNLQAKQTLQSIIDNYDGDDLTAIAREKRKAIIASEAVGKVPDEPEVILDIND